MAFSKCHFGTFRKDLNLKQNSSVILAPSTHDSGSHAAGRTNECAEPLYSRYLHAGRHSWIHNATGRYQKILASNCMWQSRIVT